MGFWLKGQVCGTMRLGFVACREGEGVREDRWYRGTWLIEPLSDLGFGGGEN